MTGDGSEMFREGGEMQLFVGHHEKITLYLQTAGDAALWGAGMGTGSVEQLPDGMFR